MSTRKRTVELDLPPAYGRLTHDEIKTWAIAALWRRRAELGSVHDVLSLTIDYIKAKVIVRYEATID